MPGEGSLVEDLTWRELDVLNLLAEHLTNREIAEELFLAESTVKDYVSRILSKLYVKNRRQAVERAKTLGLLDTERNIQGESRTNLPVEKTLFVGRNQELTQIGKSLEHTRLLTLIGPGGIGKTRLALKTAQNTIDQYKDGSFFVSLAAINLVDDLIPTIAAVLGFPLATQESPIDQLLRYLRKREIFLVMDNFEHLLECVGIISEILNAAPGVKILVTSRERLNIRGEGLLQIIGMTYPEQADENILDFDAVQLFIQHAGKVQASYEPSPDDLDAIVRICNNVDGMPLAIELAASWLHILSVGEIAAELDSDLDILTSEMRDAPRRHRSIRAVFDHSWSLLNKEEQITFMRLSIFKGGFTRESAQTVSGATYRRLGILINKSLVKRDADTGRMEIHELLRQYVQEWLEKTDGESEKAITAHAAYFADTMDHWWNELRGHDQMTALAEIEADIENVRTAWRTCIQEKNVRQIEKFLKPFWYLSWIRGWNLGAMEFFKGAVEALGGETEAVASGVRAFAMALQGYFMAWLGLTKEGHSLAEESLDPLKGYHDPIALALAYESLGVNAYMGQRFEKFVWAMDEMLKVAVRHNDPWLLAFTYFPVCMSALFTRDFNKAREYAEKQIGYFLEKRDEICSSLPLIVLGHVALATEAYQEAHECYRGCLRISRKTGFYYGIQTSTKYLGKVLSLMGKFERAEDYLLQCLRMSSEAGFIRDVVKLLFEVASLRIAQGKYEEAVELLSLVVQHPSSHQSSWQEEPIWEGAKAALAEVGHELPLEDFEAAFQQGRECNLEGVVSRLIGS